MDADTKSKIEKHIRAHRKSGGRTESPKEGSDDAEKDLKSKPERRNNAPKVEDASEAMKAKKGGRIKKEVGKAEGEMGHHHAGRKPRASGGSCESSPFTSAMRGSQPSGRKVMAESKGANH
jgi:hypothetical protein